MRAYLIRVGIDQAYGGWNAPMDPVTNEFVYLPIPESRPMAPNLLTPYTAVVPSLTAFQVSHPHAAVKHVRLPADPSTRNAHLDPDFRSLTYGDSGTKRGKGLTELKRGDVMVFYSGLRPITRCGHTLVYALVGLYQVAESTRAGEVPQDRWSENAHTRCRNVEAGDVIIRGIPGVSGRLERCIPIGEFRDRAYRVVPETLDAWGGLSCKNGYIQRSAVLPTFLAPERFMKWFERQAPTLIGMNNV
jgi:hypothetical protein